MANTRIQILNDDGNSASIASRDFQSVAGVPGATENFAAGYAVGNLLLNRSNGQVYRCTADGVWAAVSAAAGQIMPADFTPQHSLLASVAVDQTPVAVTLGANSMLARIGSANMASATIAQLRPLFETFDLVAEGDADATPTAAQITNGVLVHTPTAARTAGTETAANLIAALPNAVEGSSFLFVLRNAGTNTSTLTAGAGVSISGNAVVSGGQSGAFLGRVDAGLATVTFYRLGDQTCSTTAEVDALIAAGTISQTKLAIKGYAALGGGAVSFTAAQLLAGMVSVLPVGATTLTTPTGALIHGIFSDEIAGSWIDLNVINLAAGGGGNTSTLTAGDGDVTFVGDVAIAGATSATFRFVLGGANAVVGYRIA